MRGSFAAAFVAAVFAGPAVAQNPAAAADERGTLVAASGNAGASGELPVLAAGTPIVVVMNDEISSKTSRTGDKFTVTVAADVVQDGIVFVPKGTVGTGSVTFRTGKGGFGKPGIVAISLHDLALGDRRVALDGRYRQEGGGNPGAAAAVMFAVGVLAITVSGKTSVIPKGGELKARTGEDITFVAPAANGSAVVAGLPAAAAVNVIGAQ